LEFVSWARYLLSLILPITISYDDCSGIMLVGGAGGEWSCGGEVVYLGLQAAEEGRREGEPFKPR
jgi:hypothetical protein